MKQNKSRFKWRHFGPTIILSCVRWYCRYQLSYRDLEGMMRERGLAVDHTTVFRWVQRCAPEINRRIRPYLKMSGDSHRSDETYVKAGKEWKHLYRAVDSHGQPIGFMLSGRRPFRTAEGATEGVEAMHVVREGQVKRPDGRDAAGRAKFTESLFGVAAWRWDTLRPHSPQINLCNRTFRKSSKGPGARHL